MSNTQQCLISKDSDKLQIPYADYERLMETVREGRTLRTVKQDLCKDLSRFLGGDRKVEAIAKKVEDAKIEVPAEPKAAPQNVAPPVEKVSVEFESDMPAVEKEAPSAPSPKAPTQMRSISKDVDVPPIKKDISAHFNKIDDSGRLLSVFKQYYTCLNDTCGGTVRVTMKDGFCSLWNYDEWEEFAFIDIFEGHLRIALNPRYTDALKSLSLCEVPRLLSSRRNLVCVQVDDLNNTILDVLVQAFEEVGLTAG